MDGELWLGNGRFDEVSSLVRKAKADDPDWRHVRFMVFDLPNHGGNFDQYARRTPVPAGNRIH